MSFITFCLLVLVCGTFLVYLRISLVIATIVFAFAIFLWAWFFNLTEPAILLTCVLFLLIALPLNLPFLRRLLISNRIFAVARNMLPAISRTEQEALEAGTVWWDGELFSGKPNWRNIIKFQTISLSIEEKEFLDGPVEELCAMLDDWRITHIDQDLSPNVWQYLKEKRFFGLVIPKIYGGLGFSALAHSAVITKVASRSITAAVTIMVPNSLGPAELILHYGTVEQKKHYLPRLAAGLEIPCFALTGPKAGSDASSIPDTGIVCRQQFNNEETLGIRLNWDKRYITLVPIATVLGLAFKLYDPDSLLGNKEDLGISLALVPTDLPGVTIGQRHFPLNSAFLVGPTSGEDVFIPLDWLIGGIERAGQGWRMLMESLAAGRGISLPALSTGGAKLISRMIGAYSQVRKQFNLPIARFEGVEEALTRIAGRTYVMDSVRILTASAVDSGEQPAVISGLVKYQLTNGMRSVVNDAMDVQGGAGICLGPRNLLGRLYQAAPIGITVEGANILTRSFITFNQSLLRCHPCLMKEIKAANDPDRKKGSRQFDRALFGHLGFLISNSCRAFILGLTNARFVRVPGSGPSKRYLQQLTRMSAAFGLAADLTLLVLGGAMKRKEKISGRLADILSHLYMATATIKHFADQGKQADDLPLLRWGCENSLSAIQENFDDLLQNFPNRPIAFMLNLLIFPLGKSYKKPDDRLGRAVTRIILSPSKARDRLTEGIFLPALNTEAMAILEDALQKSVSADAAEQKIKAAVRKGDLDRGEAEEMIRQALEKDIITDAEAEDIQLADAARQEVIKVDDFSSAELASTERSEENP